MITDSLHYYRQHSPATDPKSHSALFDALPTDLPALHQIVQNVLIHVWKVWQSNPDWLVGRSQEIESRTIHDLLSQIAQRDSQPLTVERPLQQKLIVDCRHFAGLLCAMLRHQGIPTRVRNGFITYLTPTHMQDHWVCEYWNGDYWVLEDAEALKHDIPRDQFVVAGQAWMTCRAGETDPNSYGYGADPDWRGWWAIRNNVIRDLAALNKVEEMSLTHWGIMLDSSVQPFSEEAHQALDQAAVAAADPISDAPRMLYANSMLHAPSTVEMVNYTSETRRTVPLLT